MELEKEINQKKFRNESHKLMVNIIYTFNWLNGQQSDFLKPFDITYQQFNVLRILRGQQMQPASIKLIRERMLDKMSDASRIVEKLRMKGLVERHICQHDRRSCQVFITQKGMDLLSKIDTNEVKQTDLMIALSEKEKMELNLLLDKLRG
ncbi:MAG: MarR family transcriptional regulator [Bacteroidia bacterium]|nr:MarR family transcriptional regulator [Bacteroidota bacterium]MBP6428654.1 MarR family transcriptional regulator [Bacteroidia bacterium]MBP6656857.1 MarR family transcriptional regulator [Bacteroidia bacterium]